MRGRAPSRAEPPAAVPTREAILDAAERLFSARGVDGVAVRDLAREMGLTPSSLYNHFSGKQALYEAVLERGLRPIVDLVAAAPSGVLDAAAYEKDPIFNLDIPQSCPEVPAAVLTPRSTWANGAEYDRQARQLARMFVDNFKTFESGVTAEVLAAGPRA